MRKWMRKLTAVLLALILPAGTICAAAAEAPAGRTDAEIQQSVVTLEGKEENSIRSLLIQLAQLMTREDIRSLMRIEDVHEISHEVIFKVVLWMVENREVTMKILMELGLSEDDLRAVNKIWDSGERVSESMRSYRESGPGKQLTETADAPDRDPKFRKSLEELVDLLSPETISGVLNTFLRLLDEGKAILEEESAPGALSGEAEKQQLDRTTFTGKLVDELLRLGDLNESVSSVFAKLLENDLVWELLLLLTNESAELNDVLRQEFSSLGQDPDITAFLERIMEGMDKAFEKAEEIGLTPEAIINESQQTTEEGAK